MVPLRFPVLAAACLILAGCSDPYAGRMEVTGDVALKGQPIRDGAVIEFTPADGQDTAANTTINGGKYVIPRPNGLKPGKYHVRLVAGDGKTAVTQPNPDEPPGPGGPGPGGTNIISKDLVPPEYGRESKQYVTVTKEGPNKFDFTIP